jgi:hypothetical protein
MNDQERLIAELAAATPRRHRPAGLIPLLKRVPNFLRWRLIIAYRRTYSFLKREAVALAHRLQGRRIVHILHIGKTAGTAMKSALRGYENAGDFEFVLYDHEWHLHHVPRGEKVVFVLRDPISRFISGFYGRQRQDLPRHDVPWSPGEAVAFGRFKTPNELALALSSDDSERRVAAADAIKSILHLMSPQWIWFRDEAYFLSRRPDILFIGFQETLDEGFELLKRILNLPAEVSLPRDEITAHKNPAHVDRSLDPEAIRNLEVWYERDYRFLELCREIASRIRSDFEKSSLDRVTPGSVATKITSR